MNKYILATDSCADLPLNLVKELNIVVLPLKFKLNENVYTNYPDESDMSNADFYRALREGLISSTFQVNAYEFIKALTPLLEEGYDVLYSGFSSALSGTFNSFEIARQELQEKFPNRTILGVDTLCASLGQGMLVYTAAQLKASGKSIHEVKEFIESKKLNVVHLFTVDDLNFLKRGGRLSATSAFIGSLLRLKPLLHVSNEGRLVPYGKTLGRKHSINKLVDDIQGNIINPQEQTIFISHGDCIEEAQYAGNLIQAKYQCKNVIYNHVGPVIGSHSGPGTIAIFFFGNKR